MHATKEQVRKWNADAFDEAFDAIADNDSWSRASDIIARSGMRNSHDRILRAIALQVDPSLCQFVDEMEARDDSRIVDGR